ncbi:hypothetical protein GF327_09405 [Candidatus Woesearchaeota archaeon]|nr:hypothetical protein [Candidatus Woesearchaeota archaeon]
MAKKKRGRKASSKKKTKNKRKTKKKTRSRKKTKTKKIKAKKKSSKKKNSSKKLKNAKPDNYFILVTGALLKNLKELAHSFDTMNKWVFDHHVNEQRNDFSTWIRDILKEEDLAEEIRYIRDMKEMQVLIYKYIVNKYL